MENLEPLIVCCGIPFLAILLAFVLALINSYQKQLRELGNLKEEWERLNNHITILREETDRAQREAWFKSLPNIVYNNETEVEIKFIYPLVKFLGYQENNFNIRVKVDGQLGREKKTKEADWVLWDKTREAEVVIEAKSFSTSLTGEVKEQARSYAFALNSPFYILTNGKELQIYRRGVRSDDCVVNCSVNRLAEWWPLIDQEIGWKP